MIPKRLEDWAYDDIVRLAVSGRPEPERYDFKLTIRSLEPKRATTLACGFANTHGGFVIVGVDQVGDHSWNAVGHAPDLAIATHLNDKIKAEPHVTVMGPRIIDKPGSNNKFYVFEIPKSTRRPHQDALTGVFWKRVADKSEPMSYSEVRELLLNYEEKREKLTRLLLEIRGKARHLARDLQHVLTPEIEPYNAGHYSTEIIDRVTFEAFSLLQDFPNIVAKLDELKLMLGNANVMKDMYMSREGAHDLEGARRLFGLRIGPIMQRFALMVEQIERELIEKLGVVDPSAPRHN